MLQDQGKPDEAIRCYWRAIAIKPNHVKALGNLGNVLQEFGRPDEAVASFQRAIDVDPERPEPYNILGNIMTKLDNQQQAVLCYQHALSINPEYVEAQSNLGGAYSALGELDKAIASYQRALAIDPNSGGVYYNLGNALRNQRKWDEAIAVYRRALEISPSHPDAHWNYARVLLLKGQFEQGWREHEWRWECEDLLLEKRKFAQPLWDGSTLNGVTILLHCEQGLGDSIQFIRYAPMVARLGGRVVVGCPQKLRRLFQSVSGIDRLIGRVEEAPAFDVHAPLLSLPHIFKTDLETIPNTVPYLSPPSEPPINVERGDGVRVGIVWAGKSAYKDDINRSVDLGHFTSIANMEGCVFYSLQVGERRQDIRQHKLKESLIDLGEDLTDFAVTASAIEQLDLVISVDTDRFTLSLDARKS